MHSALVAQRGDAVARPGHNLLAAADNHGRLAPGLLDGLSDERLNVGPGRVLSHHVHSLPRIAAVGAAPAGSPVVLVHGGPLFVGIHVGASTRLTAAQQAAARFPVGGLVAASDGEVKMDVDAVGVGGVGGVFGARNVVLRLGGRLCDNGEVDAADARVLPRFGSDGFEDGHDEAGAGGGADEHQPLKGVPVDGGAVRAGDEAGELGGGVLGGVLVDAAGEAGVGADDELDAVAAAGAGQCVRAGNGVGMGFERTETRDPEVDVLAGGPFEVDVLDGEDGGGVANGAGDDAVADAATALAGRLAATELHVLPEQVGPARESVNGEKGNGHPEEMARIGGNVLVDEPQHDDGRGNVLQQPELVGGAPDGDEADDNRPQQDGPGAEAVLDHGHDFQLVLDKVGAHPLGPKVEAVAGGRDEHGAGDPAVQPVETLVARADEEAERVVLHGEEIEHGQLADGDPGVAEADALPVGGVVGDDAPRHEVDDDGPVAEQDEDAAEREGSGPAEGADAEVVLRMADFADDGRGRGPGLGEAAIGTGGMLDGGITT
ncbi:hypothetical protein HC256_005512 [Beauveria bassiana]|nr:hypothetical protein HC256_005512 [Beauveria bassiana]